MGFATIVLLAVPAFSGDWNKQLAAKYLDQRQQDWFAWKPAAAVGGPCLSCHTGLTYLLARPALRRALGETVRAPYETGLLAGLKTRLDQGVKGKSAQAQAVEAILAALLLGPGETKALDRMWSLQLRERKSRGAWEWFSLDHDPWEMPESTFYGASLAAVAAGSASAEYRNQPEIRRRESELAAYLQREREGQPLHNRLLLLWAGAKLPEALPESARKQIISEVWRKQQPDGGWTLDALGPWSPHAGAPQSVNSNTYATGLTAFTLQKSGVAASDPGLKRALAWLRTHQDREHGYWRAESMNKHYEAGSMPLLFMTDAATAYASLALLEDGR
jgi:squalene-hopene/tetraprenyl-beta-curcumene cyclase